MKSIVFLFLLALLYVPIQAQEMNLNKVIVKNDTIIKKIDVAKSTDVRLTLEDAIWTMRVYKGSSMLPYRDVCGLLSENTDALKMYKSGKKTMYWGDACIATGFLSLGFGIFATVNAYKDNYGFDLSDRVLGYSLIGGGAVLATAGVLLYINGQNNIRWAIDSYNNNNVLARSYQFGLTPHGVGMVVQF